MGDGRSVTVTWKGQSRAYLYGGFANGNIGCLCPCLFQTRPTIACSAIINQDSISEAPCFRARRNFPKAIIKIARVQGTRHLVAMRSMHKSIDGETANEEGIQSVRPQPCSGEGIDCSPLDDDQTGLTFIAKSSPSSCDVALCSMRSLLSALHYATLTSPFPRPPLRVHFRLRRLSLDPSH